MSILLHSFTLVTLAEMGDKTQLLSIMLAARFRCFWPILAGVLAATLLNHGLAAYAGGMLSADVNPLWVSRISALMYIAIGLWVLIPDKAPDEESEPKYGAFLTSLIAFFMAEMGDKTQLATVTLGAEYAAVSMGLSMVILGTTAGMIAANLPAIWFGDKVLQVIPLKALRITASLLFVGYGLVVLLC